MHQAVSLPAFVFCTLVAVVVLFQLALAAGAPWGHLAMGGKFPGRLPPPLAMLASSILVALG